MSLVPDFDALLYEALDDQLGVTGTLTPKGGAPVVVTVREASKTVTEEGRVDVVTVAPKAKVRMSVLAAAGVGIAALNGGTLAYNGTTWRIDDAQRRPAPHAGEAGEVLLYLGRIYS